MPILNEAQITQQKEKKTYKNSCYFTNLLDISKLIYEIGKQYRDNILYGKVKRKFHNPVALTKLFYFDYLTAARPSEPFQEPYPNLQVTTYAGWTVMRVEKVNEKHFVDAQNTKPEIMVQNLPLDDEYEKLMWDYITDSNTNLHLDTIFKLFGPFNQHLRKSLSEAFTNNFRADLTDGETIYKKAGIRPYILRHSRVYSLRFNKGYDRDLVQKFLGWTSEDMMHQYVYIEKQLKDQEQLQILGRHLEGLERRGIPKFKLGNKEILDAQL